ncbi:hypothetical protein BOM23_16500 [Erwinia sp. OLMDLW33]|nr:hypothetical protein BOM23_16500 [Erwinia sp. OLMDLW33]
MVTPSFNGEILVVDAEGLMRYVLASSGLRENMMNLTQITWFSTWTFSALFWTSALWLAMVMR